jgi:hypothetical protein
MKYFIAVETASTCAMFDLVAALRHAYDGGADGAFNILVTHEPSYMVMFERDSQADAEYIYDRCFNRNVSIEVAAMHQLAAELMDGGAGDLAQPVIDTLNSGDAQVFDFANGAIDYMATYEVEPPVLSPEVRDVLKDLADYAESSTLEEDALPMCVRKAQRWLSTSQVAADGVTDHA